MANGNKFWKLKISNPINLLAYYESLEVYFRN